MTYEELLELEEKVGNVSKGLTKAQIKKIPRFIYQKNKHKNLQGKYLVKLSIQKSKVFPYK